MDQIVAVGSTIDTMIVTLEDRLIANPQKTKYTDCLDVLQKQADGSWLYVVSTWNSEEGLDQD